MDGILDFIRSVPDSPQGLLDFVMSLLIAHGYLVVFAGAALDNFGLPASGDIVLFAGGFFANSGRAALPLVMLSGFLGALCSDHAIYWIGRYGGRPLITRILKVRLLSFLLDAKSLGKVERYFEEHGGKTVFVGRFGPGLRSMTPLFAGVSRMKYTQFLPYNLAAITFWSIAYTMVGYVFGQYWNELLAVAQDIGYGLVALVVLTVLFYVLRRRRKNLKKEKSPEEARRPSRLPKRRPVPPAKVSRGGAMENINEERNMLESAGWEPREREDGETVWTNPANGLVYPQGQAAAMVREGADPEGPQPGVKD